MHSILSRIITYSSFARSSRNNPEFFTTNLLVGEFSLYIHVYISIFLLLSPLSASNSHALMFPGMMHGSTYFKFAYLEIQHRSFVAGSDTY